MSNNNIDLEAIVEFLFVPVSKLLKEDIKKFEDYLVNHIREKTKYGDKILSLTIEHMEKSGIKEIDSILNFLAKDAFINTNNFKKIIELIRKNSWDKKISNCEYIYSDDFKKICKTPICLPTKANLILGFFSGEYILNLLAKANANDIQLKWKNIKWRTTSNGDKNDIYHRKLMKFFLSKSSHCRKFEDKLQISLKNFVVEKEKTKTLLWNIFEWYVKCPSLSNNF